MTEELSENMWNYSGITGLWNEDVEAIWAQFICHLIICLQLAGSALHLAGLPAAQLALQSLSLSLSQSLALSCVCMCVCYSHVCLFVWLGGACKPVICGAFWEDLWNYCSYSIAVPQIYKAIWPTNKALVHNCTRSGRIPFICPSIMIFQYVHVCLCVVLCVLLC